MEKMENKYICPECKSSMNEVIRSGKSGVSVFSKITCPGCGTEYETYCGCVDFIPGRQKDDEERMFFEETYLKKDDGETPEASVYVKKLDDKWNSPLFRERSEVLGRMGDLSGKTVLCIGNGDKDKELYFSIRGAKLIISDISIASVISLKKKYGSIFEDVDFHAINAYKIPLESDSVDVVYGWQMTHHLAELPLFLHEVKRVLRKGGVAVFVDNAYSPGWHRFKWSVLAPFVKIAHRKKGISPRDLQISRKGDYREDVLSETVSGTGFSNFRTRRLNLLLYVFSKAVRDMLDIVEIGEENRVCYHVARTLAKFDDLLCERFSFFRNNRRNMVWSFEK